MRQLPVAEGFFSYLFVVKKIPLGPDSLKHSSEQGQNNLSCRFLK